MSNYYTTRENKGREEKEETSQNWVERAWQRRPIPEDEKEDQQSGTIQMSDAKAILQPSTSDVSTPDNSENKIVGSMLRITDRSEGRLEIPAVTSVQWEGITLTVERDVNQHLTPPREQPETSSSSLLLSVGQAANSDKNEMVEPALRATDNRDGTVEINFVESLSWEGIVSSIKSYVDEQLTMSLGQPELRAMDVLTCHGLLRMNR